jgi:hypothetical protein
MSDADRTADLTRERLDDDPRGVPVSTGSAPIVIEKHRIGLDGREIVSFYACGVTRTSREEARQDAMRFAELADQPHATAGGPLNTGDMMGAPRRTAGELSSERVGELRRGLLAHDYIDSALVNSRLFSWLDLTAREYLLLLNAHAALADERAAHEVTRQELLANDQAIDSRARARLNERKGAT